MTCINKMFKPILARAVMIDCILSLSGARTTPVNAPPNPTQIPQNSSISNYHKMGSEEAIQKAIADLEAQEVPNYRATARKYGIYHTTLLRRFKHLTVSRKTAVSLYSKRHLTDAQEEVLLRQINILADRGMPPTPQILRNIVEESIKDEIGVHWVARFCERHQDRIKSVYLRAMDKNRQLADNTRHYEHFYQTVSSYMRPLRKLKPAYNAIIASRQGREVQY